MRMLAGGFRAILLALPICLQAAEVRLSRAEAGVGETVGMVVIWEEGASATGWTWELDADLAWVGRVPHPDNAVRGRSFGNLRVGALAQPGTRWVRLLRTGQADPVTDLAVQVKPRVDWRLDPGPVRELVATPGSPAEWVLRLDNRGSVALNGSAIVRMDVSLLSAEVEPARWTVPPGESREILVRVAAAQGLNQLASGNVRVRVDLGDAGSRSMGRPILGVPDRPDPGPMRELLEGSWLVGLYRGDDASAWAQRVDLRGSLTDRWRFDLAAWDAQSAMVGSRAGLAGRDGMRFRVYDRSSELLVGDLQVPAFGLLDTSRWGRGVRARHGSAGEQQWEVHGMRNTRIGSTLEQAGLRWQSGVTTAGVLAQRQDAAAGLKDEERLGLWAKRDWTARDWRGEVQLALAHGLEGWAPAVSGLGRGEALGLWWSAQWQETGDGFFLSGWSSQLRQIEARRPLSQNLQAVGSWSRSRTEGTLRRLVAEAVDIGDPTADPLLIEFRDRISGSEERVRAALEWAQGHLWGRIQGTSRTRTRDSLFAAGEIKEESVLSMVRWRRNALVLSAQLEGGRETRAGQRDFLEWQGGITAQAYRGLELSLRHRETWASGSADSIFRAPGRVIDLVGRWRPSGGAWEVDAGWSEYHVKNGPDSGRGFLRLTAPAGPGRDVAVEGRYSTRGGNGVWFTLRQRFGVPAVWREQRAALTGVVQTSLGQPLAGVRVRSGDDLAVTNSAGRFALPARPAGPVPLAWQMPAGEAVGADWPDALDLAPGERRELSLVTPDWSTVNGRLILTRSGVEVRLPGGLVRFIPVRGDGRTHTAVVGPQGTFTLRLPPGRYLLRTVFDLPAAVLEAWETEVDLKPGEVNIEREAEEPVRRVRRTFFGSLGSLTTPPARPQPPEDN